MSEETLSLLLSKGADINALNVKRQSPLLYRISHHSRIPFYELSCINVFLRLGARLDIADSQQGTVLHYVVNYPTNKSVYRCDYLLALIDELIKLGAPFNIKDSEGYTPYERAQKSSKMRDELVKAFETSIAQLREDLEEALDCKDFNAAQKLIDQCKNIVDMPSKFNETFLYSAVFRGDTEVVLFFIKNNAQLNIRCGSFRLNIRLGVPKETALDRACIRGEYVIVKALLDADAEINTQNEWGGTPLIKACGFRETFVSDNKIIELLLKKGADPNKTG